MASTSYSSCSNPTPTITYDVFLSFRGEDTRYTFTDHLYHALLRAGLRTFRDTDDIDKGEGLKPEIETAIIESRACIVVLSENYANSRWCLDELCFILEQRRDQCNRFVLPVFYHVDPSDVRNQRGSFAVEGSIWTTLIKDAKLTAGFLSCLACLGSEENAGAKWTEANLRRWKGALKEAADLSGLEISGSRSETKFIEEVVGIIKCKLDLKQLSTPPYLTGIEARVGVINSWLKNEQYNAIGICGMGGSGKTTLAQYFYSLNKQDFDGSSFIEVSRKEPFDMLEIQKQLLEDVLGRRDIRISTVSEGTHKIEELLKMKKLLVVLDDIDRHEQLVALLGTKVFPTKSKIIITTRVLDINKWFGCISWRCWEYKLSLLNDLESLELLSWHAFRSKIPMRDFEELAIQLTQYCTGNPLALQVLGSSLFVSDEESPRRNYMIQIWRSRMNSLNSLKGDLDCTIQGVLQKSYDSLPFPSQKELFLHIACFFVGESVKLVEMILEEELYAKSGILTLINRCLLTISLDGKLMMHQLLQEMGRRIVCEESKYPEKRSRVWRDVESYNVLKKGEGSDTIEGLAIDMRKMGMRSKTLAFETSSLANMDKLKLLQLKYVKITGSYKNFPELLWLCWHGCPLQTMPSGLLMSTLVAIDMSHGHIEMFEAPMVLNSLKYLNLKGCNKLVSICNLFRLPQLEFLSLWNCSSLTHLCKTIGDLERLALLDFRGCIKLWKCADPGKPLFSLPQLLMDLNLTNCNLEFNSHICVAFHAQSLIKLYLAFNPFEYVPSNIDVTMVRILNLYSCSNLKSLPCIPSTLEELYIDWCTSLERVTFQSGRFTLSEFSYECCFKLYEVQGLFKLVPVAKIDEADLGHLQWIKAYEDHKVDLVGDDITKGRNWNIQMLYEYGIMSTYMQGIKDKIMTAYEYTSSSSILSFRVPYHHEKNRIQGLNVSCIYRSSVSKDKDRWLLFAKISNTTKGLKWIYNPVVYCKPSVDEDVVWLSYWPIGNMLDADDEVLVEIIFENGMNMIVSECSGSFVYMDNELEEEETYEIKGMEEEVIGGDLSEFEVTTRGYYLCRRDLFGSQTSSWLKHLFGDNVHYTDSQGWRKTHQSMRSWLQRYSLNSFIIRIEL